MKLVMLMDTMVKMPDKESGNLVPTAVRRGQRVDVADVEARALLRPTRPRAALLGTEEAESALAEASGRRSAAKKEG